MQKLYSDQAKIRTALRLGDLVGYLLATLAAFLITPGDSPFTLLTVVEMYLPFALMWMVVAPFAGLFRASVALQPRQIWVVAMLTIVGTPLGAWVSVLWIGASFERVFVIVLTVLATLIIVGWRYAFILLGGKVTQDKHIS